MSARVATPTTFSRFLRPIFPTVNPRRFLRGASIFFGITGLALAIGSYVFLSNLTPLSGSRETVWTLLSFNIFVVTGLIFVLGMQAWRLRRRTRSGQAGARLHGRVIILFSTIAVLPAVFVSVFTLLTFDRGLDYWFSNRTKTIINNTTAVANAYLAEQRGSLHKDVSIMTDDLNRSLQTLVLDEERFLKFLRAQAAIRNIPQALIINRKGEVFLAASPRKTILTQLPPNEAFAAAESETVIMTVMELGQIQALRALEKGTDLFLYSTRILSPNVVAQLLQTDAAVRDYSVMEKRRFETQLTIVMVYIVLTLVILLSSIWLGLMLADRLVSPIGRLIQASRSLGEGDLQARVRTEKIAGNGEINLLSETFNEMAERIGEQQKDLLLARDRLDERAQFTEAVLQGVSSGVIGVDETGLINHVNELAMQLYNRDETALIGAPLAAAMPDFEALAVEARRAPGKTVTAQILARDKRMKGYSLRASALAGDNVGGGLVITFDDVTDLLTAQRSAAWSDIARRIAHEIKNPLTPIQLSAERLQAKFGDTVDEADEVFRQCTDTIIRQVEDIGRMVDEFASFARMPTAVMQDFDVTDVVAQVILMQRVANPSIKYVTHFDGPIIMNGDRRLISQALINIVKNAAEAMAPMNGDMCLDVAAERTRHHVRLSVSDTGPGWPDEERYALLEPYHTSRDAGTGLGLSIVKKVVDDHGGKLILKDAPWCADGKTGATVQLEFRLPVNETVGQSKVLEDL